jgi:hypothetical protein
MSPSFDPPDGVGGGADSAVDSPAASSRLNSGLRTTLEEFDVPLPPASAEYALGRLAGLEFASALGIRKARRALARERQPLLRRCFPAFDPRRLGQGDG